MAAAVIALREAHRKQRGSSLPLRFTQIPQRISQRLSSRPKLTRVLSGFSTGAGADEGKGWRKYQPAAAKLYNNLYVQVGVAGLITGNFICNIVQAQIDPTGKKMTDGFAVFELFFNVVFLVELILNMYSTWFAKFWKSGWNIFDFSVVLIGWLFQLEVPLPGPMKLLRMMRAFRVFRLFKRVESLRKILEALARAVPGVMNAFLIQLIIICIFAIIAVDRFRDMGEGAVIINEHDQEIPLLTSRGQNYGFEYYGDFGKALFTMFQVLTTESWSEAITRPIFNSNSPTASMGSAFFFVLFSILNGVVLINVVVAVLLEKMVDEPEKDEDGIPQEDPLKMTVEDNLGEVRRLKDQAYQTNLLFSDMQKQLCDVSLIKDQVAALLAHEGLRVEFRAAEIEVVHEKWESVPTPKAYSGFLTTPDKAASPRPPASDLQVESPNSPNSSLPPAESTMGTADNLPFVVDTAPPPNDAPHPLGIGTIEYATVTDTSSRKDTLQ